MCVTTATILLFLLTILLILLIIYVLITMRSWFEDRSLACDAYTAIVLLSAIVLLFISCMYVYLGRTIIRSCGQPNCVIFWCLMILFIVIWIAPHNDIHF